MEIDKAYFVGTHPYHNKSGVPAEIVGVNIITPDGKNGEILKPRLCYHIRWHDQTEDWVAVTDDKTYEIIGFKDILDGNIPKIK